MKIPIIGATIDERFLTHRLRSTSMAGVIAGLVATCLFGWRYFVDGIWSWDLLAIALTFVVVKLSVLLWYRITD